jgi:hypothetical protein
LPFIFSCGLRSVFSALAVNGSRAGLVEEDMVEVQERSRRGPVFIPPEV